MQSTPLLASDSLWEPPRTCLSLELKDHLHSVGWQHGWSLAMVYTGGASGWSWMAASTEGTNRPALSTETEGWGGEGVNPSGISHLTARISAAILERFRTWQAVILQASRPGCLGVPFTLQHTHP